MGSSSAFVVGLLHALYRLPSVGYVELPSIRTLVRDAIYIEQDVLKETVGHQDQWQTAEGGINRIEFEKSGQVIVNPVFCPKRVAYANRISELEEHLMLFYTGVQRTASDIAASYVGNFAKHQTLLNRMRIMVDEGTEILRSKGDLFQFGDLLDEAWQAKKMLGSKVSSPRIDAIYSAAKRAGAIGGKVLGAGGGGFILFFVPPERRGSVREELNSLREVSFEFEFRGREVVYEG